MSQMDWEILTDYLSGKMTEEDKRKFEGWLNQDAGNRAEFEKISKIWNAASTELPKPDTEEALKKVLGRIKTSERETPVFKIEPAQKNRPIQYLFSKQSFVRAAAAIIIFIGAAILITNILTKNNTVTLTVANKNIQSIILNDGTKVTLDAGSSFTFPEKFSDPQRNVALSGKAFFEVARNENSPFVVHAKNGLITVLGTKFNVSAWKNEEDVSVAVTEGKVSLKPETENSNREVLLTKGKMASLSDKGDLSEPVDFDTDQYMSWLNREIYFQNETFKTVVDQIERWYDVKIEMRDKSLLDNRITVFIENKPLDENIKVIAAIMNLNYEINNNKVIFSSKK